MAETETPADAQAQAEAHAQQVREKAAREENVMQAVAGMFMNGYPRDEEGKPMAIVGGQASDLVPTVPFGNVNIGPCLVLRPVPNHDDLNLLAMEARIVQMLAQYVVGTERRLIQWATDPSTRIQRPDELVASDIGFAQFVAQKLGIEVAPTQG